MDCPNDRSDGRCGGCIYCGAYMTIEGPPGPAGPQGPQGERGAVGPKGEQGIQGPKGDTGPVGPVGPQGPRGEQGTAGIAGVKGDKGDAGPQGEPGAVGPRGEKGDQGPAGPQGEQGIQGEKGDTGLQGIQGEPGAVGPKGDTGDTGPQGERGEKGDTGPRGEQGIQGEKGEKGDTGPQGERGEKGEPGEIPSVTVVEDTPLSYRLNFKTSADDVTTPNLLKYFEEYHADVSATGSTFSITLKNLILTYQNTSTTSVRISVAPKDTSVPILTDIRRSTIFNTGSVEAQTFNDTTVSARTVIDDLMYTQSQESHNIKIRQQDPVTKLWSLCDIHSFFSAGGARASVWVRWIELDAKYEAQL